MSYKWIGKPELRKDAKNKTTGKTKYMTDLKLPDMLWGKIVRAGVPSAKILNIDTAEAEKTPGVHAVVTYKDVPGLNGYGIVLNDQEVFCEDTVKFEGDAIAGVVAETLEIAEEAAKKIRIDYEMLPGVYNAKEALEEDAPKVHEDGNVLLHAKVQNGDIEKAFNEADIIVENEYELSMQEHAYLEVEGGVAEYKDDHLTMWVGSQYPWNDQRQLSNILDMPKEKIRVVTDPVGGAFGGREGMTIQGQLAIMALKVKRPVKLVNTREESIISSWKRHPMHIKIKTAALSDGTLIGNKVNVLSDTGAYAGLGGAVLGYAIEHACGAYRVPNVDLEGFSLYTNNSPCCAMRAFGVPQATFAMESQIETIAEKLGIDPLEIRLKNGLRMGDKAPYGHTLTMSMGTIPTLKKVSEVELWKNREKIKKHPSKPWKKRGIGIGTEIQAIGIGKGLPDYGAADISLNNDGKFTVAVGCPDIGQGNSMVFAQMTAEILDCPLCRINVVQADTARTPDAGVTAASRTTYTVGNAVVIAAKELKKTMMEFAAKHFKVDADKIELKDDGLYFYDNKITYEELAKLSVEKKESITAHGHFNMPEADINSHLIGLPHLLFGATTQVALVEVDTETGQIDVIKVAVIPDTGRTINIQGVEGQAEGGTVMGMGYAIMEKVERKNGHVLSDNFNTYLIPTALDIPEIETYPVEEAEKTGPFGAKGIGESICAAATPAIINAIYDAVGVKINKLPVNPEEILMGIESKEV